MLKQEKLTGKSLSARSQRQQKSRRDIQRRTRRSASQPLPAEWLDPITSKVPCQRINSNQKLLHGDSPYKLRANQFNPRKNRGRFVDLMPGG